jgi:hypothetical protein
MHAHKCKLCESRGVQTIWIHSDAEGGNKVAHKCPKCGTENWAKFMVEAGQLPQNQQQQKVGIQVLRLEDALMMAFLYATLVLVIVIVAQNWNRIISYFVKTQK